MTRRPQRSRHRTRARRAARPPIVRTYFGDSSLADEVIADNFAGGGGVSLGFELATGRSPDVAVNHDAEAIAMHLANHPSTRHYLESVWKVDPVEACGGRPCGIAWFSPDCKHHSKAKGGEPRDQKIRGLAWVAVTWAASVRPRVIMLENVEEFREWGPLHRSHSADCPGDRNRPCPARWKGCHYGKPIKARKGEIFRAFVGRLERLGYVVEHRLLRACDYGAPTTRRRLFLIARCDGRPIRWPTPTHGKPGILGLKPYRTAAEIVDWSIPCPSIFDRPRPLADKTLARIARGIKKFVLGAGRPFVIPVNHGGVGRRDHRIHSIDEPVPTVTGGARGSHALVAPMVIKAKTHGGGGNDAMPGDEPLRTVTSSKRGEFAIVAPCLVHCGNGEREGQAPRIYDLQAPLGTVVAGGQKHGLVAAFLAKHYGGNESAAGGTPMAVPVDTITTQDHHGLVAAHLIKFAGTSEAHLSASAHSLDEPAPTVTAQGVKLAQVAAFLVRYNGTGDAESLDKPAGAITTKPRFGLVTVMIDGESYYIADIGMRMLEPAELFAAQGFTPGYKIAPIGPNGKRLSKTAQIRMAGNAVCPPLVDAIVSAQL